MPELWLHYGNTEVVLDIKAENLLDFVADEKATPEEEVRRKLDSLLTEDSIRLAVLDGSFHTSHLLSLILQSFATRGIVDGIVYVPPRMLTPYRNMLSQTKLHVSRLPDDMVELNRTLLLSTGSFDPLFGYSGVPVYLLRYYGKEEMMRAYKARDGDLPRPGKKNRALSMAYDFVKQIDARSVEAVAGEKGIVELVIDEPVKCNEEIINRLNSLKEIQVEKSRLAIVSSGNGSSTLSYALHSLWNCLDAVKDEGSIALLAECRDGFGSAAIQMLVEGKIDMEYPYEPAYYVEGLEDLLYLRAVGERYRVSLVSALPNYYTRNRLGLKTYKRTKDVLQSIITAHGPKQKVLVVSDGSKLLLRPKLPN